jgi:multicomponent Na+:H+ antiporter subunit F
MATAAILLVMILMLIRALLGPTFSDRILAMNSVGTTTVLFIALLGFMTDRPEFLDIGLLYALINFVGTVAILKFFNLSDLGASGDQE